jgi:pentose-5-phosphate-3-epimerase
MGLSSACSCTLALYIMHKKDWLQSLGVGQALNGTNGWKRRFITKMQFRCCNRPIGREKGRVEQILVEVDGKVTMMTRRYLNQSPVNVLVRGRSQGLEQAAVGEGSWLCSDIRVDLLVASRPQNFGQRLSALLPNPF